MFFRSIVKNLAENVWKIIRSKTKKFISYYQCFCGESEFQWRFPCDPSDLVHFRKCIGAKSVEKILELSIRLQPKKDLREKDVLVDTTSY